MLRAKRMPVCRSLRILGGPITLQDGGTGASLGLYPSDSQVHPPPELISAFLATILLSTL